MTKKNDKVEATGKTEKKATTQPKTQKAKAGAKTVEKEKAAAKRATPEKTKKVKEQPKVELKNNTPPKKVKSAKSAQEQPVVQRSSDTAFLEHLKKKLYIRPNDTSIRAELIEMP